MGKHNPFKSKRQLKRGRFRTSPDYTESSVKLRCFLRWTRLKKEGRNCDAVKGYSEIIVSMETRQKDTACEREHALARSREDAGVFLRWAFGRKPSLAEWHSEGYAHVVLGYRRAHALFHARSVYGESLCLRNLGGAISPDNRSKIAFGCFRIHSGQEGQSLCSFEAIKIFLPNSSPLKLNLLYSIILAAVYESHEAPSGRTNQSLSLSFSITVKGS
mmetsp:Transcript_24506/g.61185  ORF Transcript_24506/g.61185 Transcript_24506/m.61185 type:complete len:217 (-) Transcript_24506:9-659(-)